MVTDPGLALPRYVKQQIDPLLKEIEALKQRVSELESAPKASPQPVGILSRLRGAGPRAA